MRKHNAADGTHQITGCKNAEGLDQDQRVRHVCRKKQVTDDRGEEYENNEIVELKRTAKSGQTKRTVILRIKGAGSRRCRGGRHVDAVLFGE
ncbi:hypothetical protein D3C80_1664640 [compost metagenome]